MCSCAQRAHEDLKRGTDSQIESLDLRMADISRFFQKQSKMPVKRGVKKAASSKVKKKASSSKATEVKREPSAGTSAAPAQEVPQGPQPAAASGGASKQVQKGVSPADLQATTQRRQKLADELQTVEKQVTR